MSSKLYYFPDIEKNSMQNDPTIPLDLQHGFNKMLDKKGDTDDAGMQNIYLKNNGIDEIDLAYQKGFEEGKKEGVETEREQVFQAISNLNTAIKRLKTTNKNIREKVETMASKLAILIAEKIIEKEVCVNREVINNTLRKSMDGFDANQSLKISMHPDDCDFLKSMDYKKNLDAKVELIPDATISMGGCIIESNTKSVDARIESQLEIVINAFEELRLCKSDIKTIEQS